ncbi:S1/P1 nuclease [Propionivibrio soli]|uniref:S1/P1 nuclease n=1 Tax=Propionivibrio soli TaxID=2976531 RepID=UPI0021E997D6
MGWATALLALVGTAAPNSASAWNAAGHRLVACIAWDQMRPETRVAAADLLRGHPDFARWQKRAGEDSGDRGVFIEVSTWADEIRKDRRFFSRGSEEPTPTLEGFPDMERHGDWHYVNRPLDVSSPAIGNVGTIDRQLVALRKTLGSPGTSMLERRYSLPWLIHLVGDAHQPLHASARVGADGRVDKLGNGFMVNNPFNSRKPLTTLHAFWDDLPGPPWLRGERLDTLCRELAAEYAPPSKSTSSEWIDESWRLARDHAYPQSNDAVPVIDEAFYAASRKIADRRVAEAGYRLADVLNQTLVPGGTSTERSDRIRGRAP